MSSTAVEPTTANPGESDATHLARLSARFGVAFAICQVTVMVAMATLVLPRGGSPSDPALERGLNVLDAETAYRLGNYTFIVAGTLLIGFLGAVHVRLRQADAGGALAAVGLASGTLLALVWPFAGVLHDVALEAASSGADVRILAGWDAVAPFSLAFSALPRVFFVGAIVVAMRLAGESPWLQRIGLAILPLSLIGSATLVADWMFPVLAISTLAYELWVGAVAWTWLRRW